MEKLQRKIGVTLGPFQYLIEKGKIKEFVLAIGDDNPIYYDLDEALAQGYRNIPIPLTFPTVMEMWAGYNFDELMQLLEMNPLRVLHAEQEYQYLAVIHAGDELTGMSTILSANQKRDLLFVVIQTEWVNQYDVKVLISRSTIVEQL
ncbi:FAS1-like dehydratase domain-containing protein [Brevibacillus daliensis]|uniref:FAS1-like dehydratase domain-containing protein n=1 Tax=Brevibacillus daliensis TaxID=2892995 RepID=UPI001E36FC67|nr:MaoC family dehydratase N-terminal domain-containing protein [Brevibacillus daliensis]